MGRYDSSSFMRGFSAVCFYVKAPIKYRVLYLSHPLTQVCKSCKRPNSKCLSTIARTGNVEFLPTHRLVHLPTLLPRNLRRLREIAWPCCLSPGSPPNASLGPQSFPPRIKYFVLTDSDIGVGNATFSARSRSRCGCGAGQMALTLGVRFPFHLCRVLMFSFDSDSMPVPFLAPKLFDSTFPCLVFTISTLQALEVFAEAVEVVFVFLREG